MNRESILLFLSLALTGCRHTTNAPLPGFAGYAGSQVRKPEVKNRNCAKTVSIYLNSRVEKEFLDEKIDPVYFLEIANLNFSTQGIDFRYDVKSVKVKSFDYRSSDFFNLEKTYIEVVSNLYAYLGKKYKDDASDVRIFITDDLYAESGRSSIGWNFWKFGNHGKGNMIVGSADLPGWNLSSGGKQEYLGTISTVIAHEQGHLLGLYHVNNPGTLMHPHIAGKYGKALQLDPYSKNRLKKILANEEKCSAP